MSGLRSKDPEVRRRAIEALAEKADPSAIDTFLSALRDEASIVRWAAVCALGRFRGEAVVDAVIGRLMDADPYVRRAAAYVLYSLHPPRAARALVRALGDTPDVADTAASALARIGPAALPAVEEAARSGRQRAVRLLGTIGGDPARRLLLEFLRSPDPDSRQAALQALTAMRWSPSSLQEHVLLALHTGDVSRLTRMGHVGAARLVRASREGNRRMRDAVRMVLERMTEARDLLILLEHEDPRVRRAAAEVVAEPGALIESMGDPERSVRQAATESLARLAAVGPLAEALRSGHAEIRKRAAWALARIGSPAAHDALRTVLSDWDGKVRHIAQRAVRMDGYLQSVEPAAARAIRALPRDLQNRILDAQPADPLPMLLEDPIARTKVLVELRDGCSERAREVLRAMLRDARLRTDAVFALAHLRDPAVRDVFRRGNEWERLAAGEALAKSGDAEGTRRLARFLDHPLSNVRFHAAKALQDLRWPAASPAEQAAHAFARRDFRRLPQFGAEGRKRLLQGFRDLDLDVRVGCFRTARRAGLEIETLDREQRLADARREFLEFLRRLVAARRE